MEPPAPNNSPKKIAAVVGLLVIVAAIAVGIGYAGKPGTADQTATSSLSPAPGAASVSPSAAAVENGSTSTGAYKDGTYNATGSYDTPGGEESIGVSVTLKDGTVTDSTVTSQGRSQDTKRYQSMFISGFKSQVVGKSVDAVNLSRVSGSSLTSSGFNDALTQIKSQARS